MRQNGAAKMPVCTMNWWYERRISGTYFAVISLG